MQKVSKGFLAAARGSAQPVVQVNGWYAGQLLKQDLPVSGGQISARSGDRVRTTGSISVTDPDGKFTPRTLTDPLFPAGAEVNVKAGYSLGASTELVSLGWFRVLEPKTKERWQKYETISGPRWVSRGQSTDVSLADRFWKVDKARFLTAQQPTAASVLAEMNVLSQDIGMPYAGTIGTITDASIPGSITYDRDRLGAMLALCEAINADPIVTPDGELAVQSRALGASVGQIDIGESGIIADMDRSISSELVYNAVVVQGKEGLQSIKTLGKGPWQWNGPYGQVPYFYQSELMDTAAKTAAAATSILARVSKPQPQRITIQMPVNFALQLDDPITIVTPLGSIAAVIREITWPLIPAAMTVAADVDPLQLASLA